MSVNIAVVPEPEPLRAVTVSRDVQEFDLLIEDMEDELGEAWGDLDFSEALAFFDQAEAKGLEFAVVAVDASDEGDLARVSSVIRKAKAIELPVVLVADGLGPMPLHELLRAGADDFAPYPLPERALSEALARLRAPAHKTAPAAEDVAPEPRPQLPATISGGTGGIAPSVYAFQSAAGGNGATTIAVNLAWEMAQMEDAPRVCILDLGLQFGSVATNLDLPRKPVIFEVLTEIGTLDQQAFKQAMTPYEGKVAVFTAPVDILPLDLIGPDEVTALLKLARATYDVVVIDMPATLTSWTDTVLTEADLYFLVCEMDVRSAQNALRFQRLLNSEGIVPQGLSWLLNKAPGKMDMSGRSRIDKLEEGLAVKFHTVLPDGGRAVSDAADLARPLREVQGRNPLTKEIAKFAKGLDDVRRRPDGGDASAPKAKKKALFGLSFG